MIILAVTPDRLRCGVSDYAGHLYPRSFSTEGNVTIKRVSLTIGNCLKIPFSGADVVHLQHEYSIYGFAGCWGFVLFCYLLLLRMTGAKLAVTIHTVYDWNQARQIFAHRTQSPWLLKLLQVYGNLYQRLIGAAASLIIVLSDSSRDSLLRAVPWLNPAKVAVIPIGVYDLPVRAQDARKLEARYSIQPGDFLLTLFGFAFPNKGYHLAIEALQQLRSEYPELKLLVVSGEPAEGGTQYLEGLRQRADKLDLKSRVIFSGFIPFDDPVLDEVLFRTDCFIYPYIKESATSGSLATTLSARKVYLTSDLEMFRAFSPGIKFRAGDVGDLAKKISIVRQMNVAGRAQYREQLESYLANNNTDAMRKRHVEAFARLFDQPAPGRRHPA